MTKPNRFDSIVVAHRSRMLFRSDAEYRAALGVSFETVVNNRESARDMEMYFGILAHRSAEVIDESLEDLVQSYKAASEFYLSLDWSDRRHMTPRRKFCRMLFLLYATACKRLAANEQLRFKIKDNDENLLKIFFPQGTDGEPSVDICLIMLFAFGILRPYSENSRGHDLRDKEIIDSLKKLRSLIDVLKGDIPRLGSTEKPLVFDEWLNIIDDYLSTGDSLEDCTPIWMWTSLKSISRACRSLVIAERLRVEGEQLCGLRLFGIWIDDADEGENRFWIFPDNNMLCFCYEYDGVKWRLSPYEFKVRLADNPDYPDTYILIAPAGNLKFILSPDRVIGPEHISIGTIEGEFDQTTGEINLLTFHEGPKSSPEWFDWRTWERLSSDDARHERFRGVLRSIYNPKSTSAMLFEITAVELIDRFNNLIGRDNRYLYVYDWQPKRCVIRERKTETFTYEVAPEEELPSQTLLDVDISVRNPLYAIPLEIERKSYGCLELDRFVEIMSDADNIREVYIMHSDRTRLPRLCFPTYSLTIALDMDILGEMGVLKFTAPPFGRAHT